MTERLAILGPNFFGYDQALAREAERRGTRVWLYADRPSHSVFAKITIRMGFRGALRRGIRQHQGRILAELAANQVRDVILFNPEVSDAVFCEKLRALGCRIVIYMWDSVSNKPDFVEILPFACKSFSFERRDAERFRMEFLPLFYEEVFAATAPEAPKLNDVYFMGSLHSRRARAIYRTLRTCRAQGLRFAADIYVQGWFMYIMRHLINPYCLLIPRRYFRVTPMSKAAIAEQFAASVAVLDIPHTQQLGLTSRTFESLASGAKLLTMNEDILRYEDLFSAESVYVLDDGRIDGAAIAEWLRTPASPAIVAQVRTRYSIEAFVSRILDGFSHA